MNNVGFLPQRRRGEFPRDLPPSLPHNHLLRYQVSIPASSHTEPISFPAMLAYSVLNPHYLVDESPSMNKAFWGFPKIMNFIPTSSDRVRAYHFQDDCRIE